MLSALLEYIALLAELVQSIEHTGRLAWPVLTAFFVFAILKIGRLVQQRRQVYAGT